MDLRFVTYEVRDSVALLTINRPDKLNAMDKQTRSELRTALDLAENDIGVKSIVLIGAGNKAFSAGQDLEESMNFSAKYATKWIDDFDKLFRKILSTSKPIVTANQGYAIGAGWQVYLLGDYRIATEDAKFGMLELNDGIPCITGSAILKPLVGLALVPRITLMADIITASDALKFGLVHELVPHSELLEISIKRAHMLGRKPAYAIKLQKEWLSKLFLKDLSEGTRHAKIAHAKAFATGEPQRRMHEFINAKRRQS